MREMDRSKERAIELAYKHHNEFVQACLYLYGNSYNTEVRNYAEDFVQEAYARLLRYDDLYEKIIKKDGTVSKGYIFFCLRSIVINALKKKTNPKYDYEGDQYDFEEKYFNPEERAANSSKWSTKKADIQSWYGLDAYEQTNQGVLDKLENKMLDVLKENADWFDYELFKLYAHSGKSYKIISEETGIASKTIYLSIKKSKLIIAEHLYEDYQDYVNGNWDLIE